MWLDCLACDAPKDPMLVLADFLRTPLARLRYGKATIYSGDRYFVPYYMATLDAAREKDACLFLGGALHEDVCVCRPGPSLSVRKTECDESYVLEPCREANLVRREIEKKIQMNRKLRRTYGRCRIAEREMKLVYVSRPSFLVKCRKYRMFIVDPLTEKVDFRHLPSVESRFVASMSGECAAIAI